MNKGFASLIFIMLTFLFIVMQSFYFLISATQRLALMNLNRMKISIMKFKEHYEKVNKVNNECNILARNENIVTNWGERRIITPCLFDGKNWVALYNETYVK